MSKYNLTEQQRQFLKYIVVLIREGILTEDLWLVSELSKVSLFSPHKEKKLNYPSSKSPKSDLDVLVHEQLINRTRNLPSESRYIVTQKAYEAVDSNFNEPDTSFTKYITPLADASNLDNELKNRCLPIVGAGSSEPTFWDSAVRTAGVILEERLRQKGSISDSNITGQTLVNKIFGQAGIFSNKFQVDSEREGTRSLYAGFFGTYRNPSAHRHTDPTPEQGGRIIMLVDLLLKELDNL
jgi:hypothetical protein